jgi:hypothetical protein
MNVVAAWNANEASKAEEHLKHLDTSMYRLYEANCELLPYYNCLPRHLLRHELDYVLREKWGGS